MTRFHHPGLVVLLLSLVTPGCGETAVDPKNSATVTVVYKDGREQNVPIVSLANPATRNPEIEGIVAVERATQKRVVIDFEEATNQHPTTGRYVILQESKDREP